MDREQQSRFLDTIVKQATPRFSGHGLINAELRVPVGFVELNRVVYRIAAAEPMFAAGIDLKDDMAWGVAGRRLDEELI